MVVTTEDLQREISGHASCFGSLLLTLDRASLNAGLTELRPVFEGLRRRARHGEDWGAIVQDLEWVLKRCYEYERVIQGPQVGYFKIVDAITTLKHEARFGSLPDGILHLSKRLDPNRLHECLGMEASAVLIERHAALRAAVEKGDPDALRQARWSAPDPDVPDTVGSSLGAHWNRMLDYVESALVRRRERPRTYLGEVGLR